MEETLVEKKYLDPLTKDGVTRTPGTPTERVQMLAQGWRAEKPKPAKKTAASQ